MDEKQRRRHPFSGVPPQNFAFPSGRPSPTFSDVFLILSETEGTLWHQLLLCRLFYLRGAESALCGFNWNSHSTNTTFLGGRYGKGSRLFLCGHAKLRAGQCLPKRWPGLRPTHRDLGLRPRKGKAAARAMAFMNVQVSAYFLSESRISISSLSVLLGSGGAGGGAASSFLN